MSLSSDAVQPSSFYSSSLVLSQLLLNSPLGVCRTPQPSWLRWPSAIYQPLAPSVSSWLNCQCKAQRPCFLGCFVWPYWLEEWWWRVLQGRWWCSLPPALGCEGWGRPRPARFVEPCSWIWSWLLLGLWSDCAAECLLIEKWFNNIYFEHGKCKNTVIRKLN